MQRTFARKVKKMSEENDVRDASTEGEYDAYEPEDEEATPAEGLPDDEKRKNGSREAPLQACQVEKCSADLSDAKRYHRHHKVCEVHAKAPTVIVAGLRQRFCQQCSRFHEVGEFDESRRSCRRRLAGHNERRRKSGTRDYHGGNSSCSWRGVLRRRKVTAGNRMKGAESGL